MGKRGKEVHTMLWWGNLREKIWSLGRRRGRCEDNLKMVDVRITLKW